MSEQPQIEVTSNHSTSDTNVPRDLAEGCTDALIEEYLRS